VANGLVYVFSGSVLVTHSTVDEGGSSTWPLPAGGAGDATPVILGERAYFVGAADRAVYAVSLDDHSVCPSSEPIAPALPGSSPAVSSAGVYYLTDDYNLYFAPLDLWPGTDCDDLDAEAPVPEQRTLSPAQLASSPAMTGSTSYTGSAIYVGTPAGDFYVWRFALDGSTNVTEPLEVGRPGGAIDSSPAIAFGFVYVGSADGNLYAFLVGAA
jgi:outer membrane protein assembly factor BamB